MSSPPEVAPRTEVAFPAGADLDLTVLVPAFNEVESLPELLEQLVGTAAGMTPRFEILVVDDGSTDGTAAVVEAARSRHPQVRLVRFRRNYGKSAALAVGFDRSRGSVVVTIDADLQDDPAEIPRMIDRLAEGYDLVSGWKQDRKDPFVKTASSRVFNWVTSLASGLRLHDFNCGLKAYRSEVTRSLRVHGELHRYLPVLAHVAGFRVTEIPVRHHARRFGVTKFGRERFLNGLLDLVTVLFLSRRRTSPLHFFGRIGVAFGAVGGAICAYFLVIWLLGEGLRLRPLMLLGIALLLIALQFISLGLLAELFVATRDEKSHYQILHED